MECPHQCCKPSWQRDKTIIPIIHRSKSLGGIEEGFLGAEAKLIHFPNRQKFYRYPLTPKHLTVKGGGCFPVSVFFKKLSNCFVIEKSLGVTGVTPRNGYGMASGVRITMYAGRACARPKKGVGGRWGRRVCHSLRPARLLVHRFGCKKFFIRYIFLKTNSLFYCKKSSQRNRCYGEKFNA